MTLSNHSPVLEYILFVWTMQPVHVMPVHRVLQGSMLLARLDHITQLVQCIPARHDHITQSITSPVSCSVDCHSYLPVKTKNSSQYADTGWLFKCFVMLLIKHPEYTPNHSVVNNLKRQYSHTRYYINAWERERERESVCVCVCVTSNRQSFIICHAWTVCETDALLRVQCLLTVHV